jgi:hypothetical protein
VASGPTIKNEGVTTGSSGRKPGRVVKVSGGCHITLKVIKISETERLPGVNTKVACVGNWSRGSTGSDRCGGSWGKDIRHSFNVEGQRGGGARCDNGGRL